MKKYIHVIKPTYPAASTRIWLQCQRFKYLLLFSSQIYSHTHKPKQKKTEKKIALFLQKCTDKYTKWNNFSFFSRCTMYPYCTYITSIYIYIQPVAYILRLYLGSFLSIYGRKNVDQARWQLLKNLTNTTHIPNLV